MKFNRSQPSGGNYWDAQKTNGKLTFPDDGDSNTPARALPSQHLLSPHFSQYLSLPPLPAG